MYIFLKDKKGKKVNEGDVINIGDGIFDSNSSHVILFKNGEFRLYGIAKENYNNKWKLLNYNIPLKYYLEQGEIIGNIFETHPLKGEHYEAL